MPNAFRSPRLAPQAGFSLIEAMIAALLLLIVILGILPLISRSLLNNLQGNDASNETNASVDGIERLLSLPFDNIAVEVPAGQMSLVATDYFLLKGNSWAAAVPSGDTAQYARVATVEQFGAADLDTDENLNTPLIGGTAAGFVQLKRITTEIQSGRHYLTTPTAYRVVVVQTY